MGAARPAPGGSPETDRGPRPAPAVPRGARAPPRCSRGSRARRRGACPAPAELELVGPLEDRLVPVGGAEERGHAVAGPDPPPAQLRLAPGATAVALHRAGSGGAPRRRRPTPRRRFGGPRGRGCSRRASSPFPIRFAVVSWPANRRVTQAPTSSSGSSASVAGAISRLTRSAPGLSAATRDQPRQVRLELGHAPLGPGRAAGLHAARAHERHEVGGPPGEATLVGEGIPSSSAMTMEHRGVKVLARRCGAAGRDLAPVRG